MKHILACGCSMTYLSDHTPEELEELYGADAALCPGCLQHDGSRRRLYRREPEENYN